MTYTLVFSGTSQMSSKMSLMKSSEGLTSIDDVAKAELVPKPPKWKEVVLGPPPTHYGALSHA